MWRFDLDKDLSFKQGYMLGNFNVSGKPQPITARPDLGKVDGQSVVFFGTGRLLGTDDLSDTSQQSIYAVKDRLGEKASLGSDARNNVGCPLEKQDVITLTANTHD